MYSDTAHCITCKAYVHQCLVVVYVCSHMSQKKFSDSWDVPEMSKRTRKLQVQCSFHLPVYVLFNCIFLTCCTSAHDIDVHSSDFIAGPMQFVDTESVLQVELTSSTFSTRHALSCLICVKLISITTYNTTMERSTSDVACLVPLMWCN